MKDEPPEFAEKDRINFPMECQGHEEGPKEVGIPFDPFSQVVDQPMARDKILGIPKADESVIHKEIVMDGQENTPQIHQGIYWGIPPWRGPVLGVIAAFHEDHTCCSFGKSAHRA